MAKLPKLKYVKFVRAKGKLYAYFNTGKIVDGKLVWASLPPFSSPGFYDSYSTHLGHRSRALHQERTLSSVIDAYMESDDFLKKSAGTQRTYRPTIKRIREQLGDMVLSEIGRAEIREMLENRISGAALRNRFLALMSIFYSFARDMEWTTAKPTDGFKSYKTGEWQPWPEALLELALKADDDLVRLGTHLLYYTGQRIGDVMKMRWSDIKDDRVNLVQQKGSKPLAVPLHANLVRELNKAPRIGITILASAKGRKMKTDKLRDAIQAFASDLGYKVVPHGLRKNAVISLLERGCTVAEVASITGQSFQIVEYYARQVDQRRLSSAAILKFEGANTSRIFKRSENQS